MYLSTDFKYLYWYLNIRYLYLNLHLLFEYLIQVRKLSTPPAMIEEHFPKLTRSTFQNRVQWTERVVVKYFSQSNEHDFEKWTETE